MRIVLCCGSRRWDDLEKIYRTLKHEHKKRPIDFVIEGGQVSTKEYMDKPGTGNARYDFRQDKIGADHQAKLAAQRLGIQVIECPANWRKFKLAAGPIRNKKQLDVLISMGGTQIREAYNLNMTLPEQLVLVLAFHKNIRKSIGTAGMVKLAKKAKVKVKVVK
jgi:hypothetical protein